MNVYLYTLIAAIASAKKSPSYRYGELASFEEGRMAARTAKMGDGFWVVMPMEKKDMMNDSSWMIFPTKDKKMTFPMKDQKSMMKKGRRRRHGRKNPPSYRYGMKTNEMHKSMKQKKRNISRNPVPASYRYGKKFTDKQEKPFMVPMAADNTRGPHPPFRPNSKESPSYRYGKKHLEKQVKMNNNLRNIKNPILISDIIAFRDMKAMSEEDMIIKPWNKPHSHKTTKFFEDADGSLGKLQQEIEIIEIELGKNLKQKILSIKAFDGMSSIMEGEFTVLSSMEGSRFRPNKDRFKAESMKNPFDDLKDKIDFENEAVRIFASIFLGLLASIVMIIFFKVLFRAWTKLGHRSEQEENRVLLKGELDSIHPISIVYKN